MQKITLIEMGYAHPSNANWSYHIFIIIDKTGAKLYKATFGGEERISAKFEVNRQHIGLGSDTQYKLRTVAKMEDIENYRGNIF